MKPQAVIESVLFAAGEPVSRSELASLLGLSKPDLDRELSALSKQYEGRGLRLVTDKRTVQLVTAPEAAPHLAKYARSELRGKLSSSAMETLAIIAYQGPVTRPDIESIRGVSSAAPLRTLSIRGLITEVGHQKGPGRPILYDTTLELLKHLGVSSKQDLPELPERIKQKADQRAAQAAAAS